MNRKMKWRHFPIISQRLWWIFRPMMMLTSPAGLHSHVWMFPLVWKAPEFCPNKLRLVYGHWSTTGAHQASRDSWKSWGHQREVRLTLCQRAVMLAIIAYDVMWHHANVSLCTYNLFPHDMQVHVRTSGLGSFLVHQGKYDHSAEAHWPQSLL